MDAPQLSAPVQGRFRTSSGVELAFDRYGSGSDRLLVVSHGIFGHRSLEEIQTLARFLAPRFDVLTWDCRGHGDSGGRFSFGMREWRDLAELVAEVRRPYRAVGGVGFSFGAFHTCVAAARAHCFDAVVLVSGPKDFGVLDHNPFGLAFRESLPSMLRRKRRRTRLALALGPRVMPIHCVADLRVPVHFIHGDRDWIVHHKHSEALYERAPERRQLTILEGGLHAEYLLTQMPERVLPLIADWLAAALDAAAARAPSRD